MNTDNFSDNSDSSDEDYNPGGPTEVVSEVDSDGEAEDPLSDTQDWAKDSSKRGLKRKKRTKKISNKKENTSVNEEIEEENVNKPVQSIEDKKKHADSLWDMFKQDTGFKSTSKVAPTCEHEQERNMTIFENGKKCNSNVKITQIFEFAGEDIEVEKEVSSESAEARLCTKLNTENISSNPNLVAKNSVGLRGIGSVLNHIGKKQKLSTLDKSKLDWDRFKKDENIEEELKAHSKGKASYLDKQDFLERADLRRFEIEREVRTIERNKRLNNVSQ